MLEQQKLHGVAQNLSKPLGTVNYQPVPAEQLQSTESYRQVIDSYQKAMQLDPTLSIVVSARMLAATQNQMLNYEQLLKDMQASP
jgi:isochorismate synthase EntC